MVTHEAWLTKLLNAHFAAFANWLLALFGLKADNPATPWEDFIVMQIVVAAIILILFFVLRSRLSVDRPGVMQHVFELVHNFVSGEAEDRVGHEGHRHIVVFETLFLFILVANLIGVIPGFISPTQVIYVPVGCAVLAFLYFNWVGMQKHGIGKYAAHFAGPVPWLAPLMLPIEIISTLARPMSLSVRLFANMYAGEQVTLVFLGLTYLLFPAIFMGLHVFVALLQAYIFMLLTMIYVGGAVAEDH